MIGKIVSRLAFVALPVTLVAGLVVAGSPATTAAPRPGLTLDGHRVDKVLVDGTRMMSYADYLDVESKAIANRTFLELHIDPASVQRGHFVAFTSAAGSRAFQKANGLLRRDTSLGNAAKGDRERRAHADAVPAKHTLNGREVTLATCNPFVSSGALMYDGIGCTGGSYISMWTQDKIYNFSDYGWNDRISSAIAGTCIYMLKMFKDANFIGASQILYGPNHYLEGFTLGNQVSSATTPGTLC